MRSVFGIVTLLYKIYPWVLHDLSFIIKDIELILEKFVWLIRNNKKNVELIINYFDYLRFLNSNSTEKLTKNKVKYINNMMQSTWYNKKTSTFFVHETLVVKG